MKQKIKTSKKWKVILWVITVGVTSIGAIVGLIYGFQPNVVTYDGEAPIGYQQPDLNINPNEKNQNLKYYMVSVGNGLSSFIKLSKSKSAIVFDTGIGGVPARWKNKEYQYNATLVDCLRTAGVETIDAIFFTHFHTDHYSSLRNVITNFPIKRIIPNISYGKWNEEFGVDLKNHNIKITKGIKTNYLLDDIVFEDWSYSAKLWMENLKEKTNEKENNKTNMISFQYYGKRFLISGDAENQLGNEVLKTANYIKPVDFYQVSHHGSNNALGNNFVSKIKPKYCYIPGTTFKGDNDPWFKFVGSKMHTFPKESTIQDLKKFTTNIRMTGKKPSASWSTVIKIEQKTLIFDVNNMGMINESTSLKTVISS